MMPCAGIRRHKRGLAFPGCGYGVIVPTSMCPNPKLPRLVTWAPSLSMPAANPTALGNVNPITLTGSQTFFPVTSLVRPNPTAQSRLSMMTA